MSLLVPRARRTAPARRSARRRAGRLGQGAVAARPLGRPCAAIPAVLVRGRAHVLTVAPRPAAGRGQPAAPEGTVDPRLRRLGQHGRRRPQADPHGRGQGRGAGVRGAPAGRRGHRRRRVQRRGLSVQAPTSDQAAVLAAIERLTPERGRRSGRASSPSLSTIAIAEHGPRDRLLHAIDRRTPRRPPPRRRSRRARTRSAVIVLLTDGENNEPADPGRRPPRRPPTAGCASTRSGSAAPRARRSTSTDSGSTPSSTRRRSSGSPTSPAARITPPRTSAGLQRSTTRSTASSSSSPRQIEVTALFAGAGVAPAGARRPHLARLARAAAVNDLSASAGAKAPLMASCGRASSCCSCSCRCSSPCTCWACAGADRRASATPACRSCATALPRSSFLRRHLPFALFALGRRRRSPSRLPGRSSSPAVPDRTRRRSCSRSTCRAACARPTSRRPGSRPPRTRPSRSSRARGRGPRSASWRSRASPRSSSRRPTTRQVLLDAIRSLTTGRRTAIGSGILAAIDAIAEIDPNVARSVTAGRPGVGAAAGRRKGAYAPDIIVLLTDGASNAGPDPVDAAQQAADRGLRVYTIGFGTADGGDLDPDCAPAVHRPRAGRRVRGGFGGFGGGGGGGGFRRGIDEEHARAGRDRPAASTTRPRAPSELAAGVRQPADEPDHEARGRRDQRRVRRRSAGCSRRWRSCSGGPGARFPDAEAGARCALAGGHGPPCPDRRSSVSCPDAQGRRRRPRAGRHRRPPARAPARESTSRSSARSTTPSSPAWPTARR